MSRTAFVKGSHTHTKGRSSMSVEYIPKRARVCSLSVSAIASAFIENSFMEILLAYVKESFERTANS